MNGPALNHHILGTIIGWSKQLSSSITVAFFATSLNFVFTTRYFLSIHIFFKISRVFSGTTSSLESPSKVELCPEFIRNICFPLLKVLSSDSFRYSGLQADTLDLNEFFWWVHVLRFESGTNLSELSGDRAHKHSEGFYLASIFDAVNQNCFGKWGRRKFVKSSGVQDRSRCSENADSHVLEMYHGIFHEPTTPLSLLSVGADYHQSSAPVAGKRR